MDDSKPDRSSDKGPEAPNVVKDDIYVNPRIRDVKAPKVFGRLKEEFESVLEAIHQQKKDKSQNSLSSVERDDEVTTRSKQSSLAEHRGSPRHHKETHGRGEDIGADTSINEFKGPNIFHRAKEEFEAIVDTIHSKREAASPKKQTSLADRRGSPRHHKETHGRGEDIDPDTPISEFKGPNIFHRAKEEFEAIVDTINSKKESASPKAPSLAEHRGSPSHHKETHGRGDDINADIPIGEFKGPNIFHRAKEEIEAFVDTINSKKESDNDAASPKKDGFRASISKKLQRTRNRD